MSGTDSDLNLFTPVRLGPYTLPNRLVMAPMTRSRAGEGNVVTELTAEYYAQRASAGLLITEGTQVSPGGVGYTSTPGMHSDAQVAGWRRVTDAVYARGGRIFAQLWHVGRVSHPSFHGGKPPVAPSAIGFEGQVLTYQGMQAVELPRALETSEVAGVVAEFRYAAHRALEAGFDGVELHGANGYLIEQFLRDGTNQRDDRYGGSVENRVRFLDEVTEAVAEVWGADRVGVRLSPRGASNGSSDSNHAATYSAAVRTLDRFGLAYLHLLESRDGPMLVPGEALTPALRPLFRGPLIVNGGYTAETGNSAIANGQADLVSYGTAFLANPDLPRRFSEGAPLNTPDRATFYGGDARGYTDYPALDAGWRQRDAA